MRHIRDVILGENTEEQTANLAKIIRLGFPQGVIAVCPDCNDVQEFTVEKAAEMNTAGEWPRCHGRRMVMDDPNNAPAF